MNTMFKGWIAQSSLVKDKQEVMIAMGISTYENKLYRLMNDLLWTLLAGGVCTIEWSREGPK